MAAPLSLPLGATPKPPISRLIGDSFGGGNPKDPKDKYNVVIMRALGGLIMVAPYCYCHVEPACYRTGQ